jgi:sulfiredoxin
VEQHVEGSPMKDLVLKIDEIYVPTARRQTADPGKITEIAESMLENGQQTPIMVRDDGKRLILVEGLQRMEAAKTLGEETIIGIKVQARRR